MIINHDVTSSRFYGIITLLLLPIASVPDEYFNIIATEYQNATASVDRSEMELGTFSISLAVDDITASLAFYQKLGFSHIEGLGGIDQKWLILTNGSSRIGLFQGMFPTNTITFNPPDARTLHESIMKEGISVGFSMGLENNEGPCSFTITDPDGNPVLIAQQ